MDILNKIGESILIGFMILIVMLAIAFMLALAISKGSLAFLITVIIILACVVYSVIE